MGRAAPGFGLLLGAASALGGSLGSPNLLGAGFGGIGFAFDGCDTPWDFDRVCNFGCDRTWAGTTSPSSAGRFGLALSVKGVDGRADDADPFALRFS